MTISPPPPRMLTLCGACVGRGTITNPNTKKSERCTACEGAGKR